MLPPFIVPCVSSNSRWFSDLRSFELVLGLCKVRLSWFTMVLVYGFCSSMEIVFKAGSKIIFTV